jgi:hypothetical protein
MTENFKIGFGHHPSPTRTYITIYKKLFVKFSEIRHNLQYVTIMQQRFTQVSKIRFSALQEVLTQSRRSQYGNPFI